ncbi:MFS transporter [Melioribacter sp. Ez-97]|uniref:MFS transporter n=1 Tax=Melioribacter sp. Ez-97 TaxID=3423434 RepID=UPI003EDA5CF7
MHKNFYLALVGIAIGGIGFGLINPVTVILLEKAETPALLTGFVTTAGYVSIVIFSPLAGKLIKKYSIRKIGLIGFFIWTTGALAHIYWYNYPVLLTVKFIMGVGGTLIFVSTEFIINYYSDDTNRGKNTGIYVVLLSIGIALGTLLIWTLEISDWAPFLIGSAVMFIVWILYFLFFEDFRFAREDSNNRKMRLTDMPFIGLVSSAVYGTMESSLVVVIPIYGLRSLYDTTEVSSFLTSFVVGGIILLYLIGYMAEKTNKSDLLSAVSLILAALFMFPLFHTDFVFLVVLFFLIGGIVPAYYTLGLNYTMEKVDKHFIAEANGYYVMFYGIGTIAGPVVGSLMIDVNARSAYWIFASLLCLFFLLILRLNKKKAAAI